MNPKQLNEQKLKQILMELYEFDDENIDNFEITGEETVEELNMIALGYHIDQITDTEEKPDFFNDKYDF